jgi:hypothetical protein
MIPAEFGSAIGNFALVGHAVGHKRTRVRTTFRVSATHTLALTAITPMA